MTNSTKNVMVSTSVKASATKSAVSNIARPKGYDVQAKGLLGLISYKKDGVTYRLRQSVANKIRTAVVTVAVFGSLFGASELFSVEEIDSADVKYSHVYIDFSASEKDGHYKTVDSAIRALNDGKVDARELVPFFDKENGVKSGQGIQKGVYEVPVYVGE